MDIQISKSDKGLSYAIKRQLQTENVDVSKINSCWVQIMNAFKGDTGSKVNGKSIAEQWNTLHAKVQITAKAFITITDNTWEYIKSIVNKASGKDDKKQLHTRVNDEGQTEFVDSKGRVVQRKDGGLTCDFTYEGNSMTPSSETQTSVVNNAEEGYSNTTKKEYTYKYGNPPRITNETTNSTDKLTGDWQTTQSYEYNEQGVLLSSHEVAKCLKNPNGKPFTLIKDYEYDSKGNKIKQIDRNPVDNSIKQITEWTYNSNNQKIHEKQTDGNGNLILETDIAPEKTLEPSPWTSSRRKNSFSV